MNLAASEIHRLDFLGGSVAKNPPAMQATRVRSLRQEDPVEKEMVIPLQYSCLENPRTEERGRLQPTGSQKSWT